MDPPICVEGPDPLDGGTGSDGSTSCGACAPDAPVCDVQSATCRGCVADAECGDGVCRERTGTCVPSGAVLYVAPTGSDAAACTAAAPCASVARALEEVTASVHTIRVADGMYTGQVFVDVQTPSPILISGEDADPAGAILSGSTTNNTTIRVDSQTSVELEGLTVGDGGGDGIESYGAVSLYRMLVRDNQLHGVDTQAGTLHIEQSTIANNGERGLDISRTVVVVHRTEIVDNDAGGIETNECPFSVTNTIIARNGRIGSDVGGLRITTIPNQLAELRFVTVVGNLSSQGPGSSGIYCSNPFTIDSSIVFGNGPTAGSSQLSFACSATYSLFSGPTAPSGQGNLVAPDAGFVSQTDLHLTATSPAVDAANPAATNTVDFDGNPRPSGPSRDIGADELTLVAP